MTVSGALGRTQRVDGGPTEGVLSALPGELAQFAGTWPQQEELPTANLGPSSVLGSFLRRWFSSW